eukprot:TRINITY_DN677_c0_g2_i1.p1 TRINITY_DN677_c0_g2~~TRINITY_DN677_c0_g2_i1.p1  ORF type:complete len:733 (-),score=209.50 TRINITY_DN677_c0_g2_i1:416-2614(-)
MEEQPKRVWTIHSADTGKSFEIHLENEGTVEQLQTVLAEVCGVSVASQVLINESGINVRSGMRLTSPRHESPIFVFNLQTITASEPPRRRSMDMPVLTETKIPDAASQLDDSDKGAQLAKMLQARADEMCDTTKQNIAEQAIMARALMSARSNLVGHAAHFCKKFTAFNEELGNCFNKYDQILASCDTGFEALEKVTLPLELVGGEGSQMGTVSMSESTVVQNMQSIRSYVAGALQQLKGRFTELSVMNMETSARLEVDMDMSELEPKGSHFVKLEEQVGEMQQLQASQHSLAENVQNLPTMYSNDAKLGKTLRLVLLSQEALHHEAHTRMRCISGHQSQIQKMAKSISGYKDSLRSLDRYFGELEHVPHMSIAFQAGVTEVHRRVQFREAYSSQVAQCTVKINDLVEREVKVRKAFSNTHGKHLPPMLIPGLNEMPPAIDIEVPWFDCDLPRLESLSARGEGEAARGEGEAARGEGEAARGEGDGEQGLDQVSDLKQALETIRQERDAIQQSTLELHWKVSTQEAAMKSMDDLKLNNTSLELQLNDTKSNLARAMAALEARTATLNEIRQLVGMSVSAHSVGASDCSSGTSYSESQHDSGLLDLLRAQKAVAAEVLQARETTGLASAVRMGPEFNVGDVAMFLRRRSSQLVGCTETEVYQAVTQGDTHWFLHPVPSVGMGGEKPRLVIGELVEVHQMEAGAPPEQGDPTPFGLREGEEYHCVKLANVKTFT